ncbi:methyltransferase domain-containing protein [Candidatus Nomurabacteria bacterium]|nr:methyltransferase domain-containing protein [Candidatus Nomurabacteria bacterium]
MVETLKSIWQGKTILRTKMHQALETFSISGEVVDVGGGRSPEYFKHFKSTTNANVTPVDLSLKNQEGITLDLETDNLPFDDDSTDFVLMFNLLEHIYNYRHVVGETYRILKTSGQLIGFVPFLIQYHPDPHDYFRYTKESLRKILKEAGYIHIEIKEVGGGPFLANFNNIVLSIPKVCRVFVYPFYACMDYLFLKLRPKAKERYPLGYVFMGEK